MSDAVQAIIAGAGSRPAEELVTALRKVRVLFCCVAFCCVVLVMCGQGATGSRAGGRVG